MKKSDSNISIPSGSDGYDHLNASSATDCTGLIPAAPAEDEELENYEELYPFLPKAISSSKEEDL